MGNTRWRPVALGLVVGVLALVLAVPSTATAAGDPREVKGRALFAKGEYQRALEIYATLFAEKGDPLYLRNIGRCYQKLQEPGKAIDSFKEYLRRSPRLKASERDEIQGFIHEMEELRAERRKAEQRSEPVAPPPVSPAEARAGPVEPIKPPPSEPPARARPLRVVADDGTGGAKPPLISKPGGAGGATAEESGSILTRWWFWAGVGAVLAAGAVTTLVILNGRSTSFPDCMTGYTCPR